MGGRKVAAFILTFFPHVHVVDLPVTIFRLADATVGQRVASVIGIHAKVEVVAGVSHGKLKGNISALFKQNFILFFYFTKEQDSFSESPNVKLRVCTKRRTCNLILLQFWHFYTLPLENWVISSGPETSVAVCSSDPHWQFKHKSPGSATSS